MTKDEALKMAIEALMVGSKIADTFLPSDDRTIQISKAINACKEALEQPAQTDVDLELKQFSKNLIDNQTQDEHPLSSEQLWDLYETEQPAQEPVAWLCEGIVEPISNEQKNKQIENGLSWTKKYNIPLYTHPHQWQGLTDDEMLNILTPIVLLDNTDAITDYEIALAIEQALKEKNT